MRPGDIVHHSTMGFATVLKSTQHTPYGCVRVEWHADGVRGKIRKDAVNWVTPNDQEKSEQGKGDNDDG